MLKRQDRLNDFLFVESLSEIDTINKNNNNNELDGKRQLWICVIAARLAEIQSPFRTTPHPAHAIFFL